MVAEEHEGPAQGEFSVIPLGSTDGAIRDRCQLGPDEIIVVTGGSGFLGQHIIRVLNEGADGIKEIRVLDIRQFLKKLEYEEKYPCKYYPGDIRCQDDLDEAFRGATAVIHTAAIVDIGHYVDKEEMFHVNVIGTKNVVEKCREHNILKLLYTSTVDTVVNQDTQLANSSEDEAKLPQSEEECLMGYYAYSKGQAEEIILSTNILPTSNQKSIKAAILRPTVLYGEEDNFYIKRVLKTANATFGFLPKPFLLWGQAVLQCTYAGNAAWAHALALHHLHKECLENNEGECDQHSKNTDTRTEVSGQVFFVGDDTKPTSVYDFVQPYLSSRKFRTLVLPVPFTMMKLYLDSLQYVVDKICTDGWKKWFDEKSSFPTSHSFKMIHGNIQVSSIKSSNLLNYKPIYGVEEAATLSQKYYNSISL